MMTNSDIKKFAWQQMRGNWANAIAAFILVLVITLVTVIIGTVALIFCFIPTADMPIKIDPMIIHVSGSILIALSILCFFYFLIAFALGLQMMFLRIVRGEQVAATDVFKGFSRTRHLKHFAGVVILIYIFAIIVTIPETIANFKLDTNSWQYMLIYIATMAVSYIMSLFLGLSTVASADNPDMKALDAIKISLHLMRNRKLRFFLLTLSFLGWYILSMFTFGLALIVLQPYMLAAETIFYLSAYGEDYQSSNSRPSSQTYQNNQTNQANASSWNRPSNSSSAPAAGATLGNIFESAKNDPQYIELQKKEQEERNRRNGIASNGTAANETDNDAKPATTSTPVRPTAPSTQLPGAENPVVPVQPPVNTAAPTAAPTAPVANDPGQPATAVPAANESAPVAAPAAPTATESATSTAPTAPAAPVATESAQPATATTPATPEAPTAAEPSQATTESSVKKSSIFQTEEDALASYERWKREHNIVIVPRTEADAAKLAKDASAINVKENSSFDEAAKAAGIDVGATKVEDNDKQ